MLKKLPKIAPFAAGIILAGFAVFLVYYLRSRSVSVFDPQGIIGQKERNLIYFALGLAVLVVVPVFIMLFSFAWKYREGNTKAKYEPELGGNRKMETVWWLIPGVLILILSIVTWNSSHDLDPFKPLVSNVKPLHVQVIALDWKWLFIYPDQNVASVNELHIPINTPINFTLTSDAPMNSFWIPQLGGQIYAMPGMSTQLHLMANKAGNYYGSSANISGKGFADMAFMTRATSRSDFDSWVAGAKAAHDDLTQGSYDALAKPSEPAKPTIYSSVMPDLYTYTVLKYMVPAGSNLSEATAMQAGGAQ